MNVIINWISVNYIEFIGTILSLIYLYFSVRQKIWLWLFGILASTLYIYVFFVSKFYADMGLQVYYLIVSVYGWYFWLKGKQETGKIEIKTTNLKTAFVLIIVTIVLFFIIGLFLDYSTDSDIPYWDSFTTSASITATWMLARKHLEHWLIWIVVDLVSMSLYIYKGLYATTFLFAIYTIMAVVGFFMWRKQLAIFKNPEDF
jgi:nicotinamide mononucleotide transporter